MRTKRNLSEEIDGRIREKRYRLVNSVIIRQEGEILAERYYNGFDRDSRNVLRSVMKSILSAAAGIALQKGLLPGLDVPVSQYLEEFREKRDLLHPMITLRHLLTMTSGIYWTGGVHYHCPMMEQLRRSGRWVSHIADCAVTDIPGTRYNYKEFDVILLAAALGKVCGDLYDFIDTELYQPLGIKSGRWYCSPDGVYYTVSDKEEEENASNLTARELLAFGELYLNRGVFEGRRILSEEYCELTTSSFLEKDYGYLWWCGEGWYAARGFGGQRVIVFPEKRAVAVMQATPTPSGRAYDDVIMDLFTCGQLP